MSPGAPVQHHCPHQWRNSGRYKKYNSFVDYPAIAMRFQRAATPEFATLSQDARRHRNDLAPYAWREIYREITAYLQNEISPFPNELAERLSESSN
jgi:hypothetical protein